MTTATSTLKPQSAADLVRMLKDASENRQRLTLYKEEAADGIAWLDVSQLNKIVKYNPADATIKVQSGMTMGALYTETAKNGQTFPLSYPEDMTLLAVLAADMPAPETGVYGMGGGYPRDFILGMEIATTDGELTHCGGEVVKNVTGYDLVKFYTGSRNTLGVVTTVALKLAGLPEASMVKRVSVGNPAEGVLLYQRIQASNLPLSACLVVNDPSGWHALLRFSGYQALVSDAVNALEELAHHPPVESEDKALTAALFDGVPALRAEVAVPVGSFDVQGRLEGLLVQPDKICFNPAAGLMTMDWREVSMSSTEGLVIALNKLAHDLHAEGGFVQLLRFPTVPGFVELVKNLNLPPDEINRELMRRFKTLYDPNGVLYSRVLPL